MYLTSLTPGRSGHDFKYRIFNLILRTGFFRSSYDNAFRWMTQNFTDDKSPLVQVMAWCRQTTSHFLSQCWPRTCRHMVSLGHNEVSLYIYGNQSTIQQKMPSYLCRRSYHRGDKTILLCYFYKGLYHTNKTCLYWNRPQQYCVPVGNHPIVAKCLAMRNVTLAPIL